MGCRLWRQNWEDYVTRDKNCVCVCVCVCVRACVCLQRDGVNVEKDFVHSLKGEKDGVSSYSREREREDLCSSRNFGKSFMIDIIEDMC